MEANEEAREEAFSWAKRSGTEGRSRIRRQIVGSPAPPVGAGEPRTPHQRSTRSHEREGRRMGALLLMFLDITLSFAVAVEDYSIGGGTVSE